MGKINLCLGFYGDTAENGTAIPSADTYKSVYKKIISFLYKEIDFPFSFFFPGTLLEWLQCNHEEFISLVDELCSRKQIEILGGGFYSPQFPLLQPADRVGQLEMLTTTIRKYFGKRPRGCWLNHSVWDSSLISSLNTCGIEYVLLDTFLYPDETKDDVFSVGITEDLGKSVFILPLHNDLLSRYNDAKDFVDYLYSINEEDKDKVICCFINETILSELLSKNWFSNLFNLLKNNEKVEITLPSKVLKNTYLFNRMVIPYGMSKVATEWAIEPYKRIENQKKTNFPSIRDFYLLYPEIHNVYSKMMYVSFLINQCRGDKARKKAAKDELLKAQNGAVYWYLGSGGFLNSVVRRKTYSYLLAAENYVREAGKFQETINSFDVNMDGIREYVVQFALYNAYLSRKGASIYELDILRCQRNFADTVSSFAHRKLFADFMLNDSEYELLKFGKLIENRDFFSNQIYKEQKFDRLKKDVKLEVQGIYDKKNTIKLVKEFHFTKNSIRVDYRLVNISKENLHSWFIVENSFSLNDLKKIKTEASADDVLIPFVSDDLFLSPKGIFYIRMNDLSSDCCFTLSSSDPACLYYQPVCDIEKNCSVAVGFAWNVNLEPGAVISRTITLYVKDLKEK